MEAWYTAAIAVGKTLFKLEGIKFKTAGIENIPKRGGAVVAINHTSYLDFFHAANVIIDGGRYVRYMAKKEIFDNKWAGPAMRGCKHISVDRTAGGDALPAAVAALKAGELVGVYPEATISRSFEIKQFKTGAARLALDAGVPIIPIACWGSQRTWTKGHPRNLGRVNIPIHVVVGEPIQPEGTPAELTAKLREVMVDLLAKAQEGYPMEPGAYWVPARLGGSAPTLEEASKLDEADQAERMAKKAHREAETSQGEAQKAAES